MGFIETSYGSKPNLTDVNVNSSLDMKNYDIINVDKFMCKDYLGALQAEISNTVKLTIPIESNISGIGNYTKKFRIPSNFINSEIKCEFDKKPYLEEHIFVYEYDILTETYTKIKNIAFGNSYVDFNVEAGKYYCFGSDIAAGTIYAGTLSIKCDYIVISDGAVWEVVE